MHYTARQGGDEKRVCCVYFLCKLFPATPQFSGKPGLTIRLSVSSNDPFSHRIFVDPPYLATLPNMFLRAIMLSYVETRFTPFLDTFYSAHPPLGPPL